MLMLQASPSHQWHWVQLLLKWHLGAGHLPKTCDCQRLSRCQICIACIKGCIWHDLCQTMHTATCGKAKCCLMVLVTAKGFLDANNMHSHCFRWTMPLQLTTRKNGCCHSYTGWLFAWCLANCCFTFSFPEQCSHDADATGKSILLIELKDAKCKVQCLCLLVALGNPWKLCNHQRLSSCHVCIASIEGHWL